MKPKKLRCRAYRLRCPRCNQRHYNWTRLAACVFSPCYRIEIVQGSGGEWAAVSRCWRLGAVVALYKDRVEAEAHVRDWDYFTCQQFCKMKHLVVNIMDGPRPALTVLVP